MLGKGHRRWNAVECRVVVSQLRAAARTDAGNPELLVCDQPPAPWRTLGFMTVWLAFVRGGGTHRYVRRSDVLALASRPLTREQEQSRWLHAAVAGHVVTEPDAVLGRARENLDRFSAVHAGTMAAHWLGLWRAALDDGPDRVLGLLVSDSAEAAEIRRNSLSRFVSTGKQATPDDPRTARARAAHRGEDLRGVRHPGDRQPVDPG